MFSIIVLMAMATSLMAPSALRFVLARVSMSEEESQRLRREELALGSQLAQTSRVLLPVRLREGAGTFALQRIEHDLITQLGSEVAVTLLTIAEAGKRAQGTAFLNDLSQLFPEQEVNRRVLEGNRETAVDQLLDEAKKDYDLIILGATERSGGSSTVFNPIIDRLLRLAPCPTMIVKAAEVDRHWPPKNILVPTNGSASSRQAAEVAFALARESQIRVKLLNVISETPHNAHFTTETRHERRFDNAHHIVDTLRVLGESQGIFAEATVRVGPSTAEVILDIAEKQAFDLIILGTDLRPGSERLFLGPNVEAILEGTPCPVIIYNSF
jgi:nucleotide-binding universal stress UspA family protein